MNRSDESPVRIMYANWRPGTPPEVKVSYDEAIADWIVRAFDAAGSSLAEFARRRDLDNDDSALAAMIQFQIIDDHQYVEARPRHDPEWWDNRPITSWSDPRLAPGAKEQYAALMDRAANPSPSDETDDDVSDAEWDVRLTAAAERHGLDIDLEWLHRPSRPADRL